MPRQPFDITAEYWESFQFTSAWTPGTFAAILTSQGYDRIVSMMLLTNSDTVDHVVYLSRSSDNTGLITGVKVPAGAGHGAVAPVELISSLFPAQMLWLWLEGAGVIYADIDTAPGSGKVVNLYWQGGYF